ncbi:MAG: S-layer homology domain-containing protein [Oscillospiraceae bacterium]|nr:S-layer homology domain-containing protein [Oscillospiraceae bacterium]
MSIKRILLVILALALLCGPASAAAVSAGDSGDPLISKSYIDGIYPDLVLAAPFKNLSDAMTALAYKLSQTSSSQSGVAYRLVMPDGTISLTAGSGFTLVFGSVRLTANSGTVLDLTSGTPVSRGSSLVSGHRYLAAENTTAAATAVTGSKIAVCGSVFLKTAAAPTFTDVTENHWHYPYVCYAVQKGLVNGRNAQSYDPDANLSIAEAVKLAACMHQLYGSGRVTLVNDPALWYKSYLDYALANGIVTKTYANYDAAITRSEFVAVFYPALPKSAYVQKNAVGGNAIPDVKASAENAEQIYAFYRAGILIGSDGYGTFYPGNPIRRSEVAAIVTRMFEEDARQSITL